MKEACINDMATRSFRDVADLDYIAARVCYKTGLTIQFLWMAQQCIEKYLKAILIYNRKSTKKIGHDLLEALKSIEDIKDIDLNLSSETKNFIEFLNVQGINRYLEIKHYTRPCQLVDLDRSVWEIRRYCKILDVEIKLNDGSKMNLRDKEIAAIKSWDDCDFPHKFNLISGKLEKILKTNKSEQRNALVWNNLFYGKLKREYVRIPARSEFINPTHIMHPEYFEEYNSLIKFPKYIVEYFRSR